MTCKDIFDVCSRGLIKTTVAVVPVVEAYGSGVIMGSLTVLYAPAVLGAAAATPLGWVAIGVGALAFGSHFTRITMPGSRLHVERDLVAPLNDMRERRGLPRITFR